jgi:glycosyltransferase involved in cell wall biosynthesis
MKALLIYHAGASLNARTIFHELSLLDSLSLSVIAPERLQVEPVYDRSGWLLCPGEESSNGYRMSPVPLRNPSRYGDGFERQTFRSILRSEKPDVVHVLDEPVSGYLFQVVWEHLTTSRQSKLLFYAFENIPFRFRIHSRMKWTWTWRQMAGGVGANSECLENLRNVGFPKERPLERIFWGIPTDVFRPMNKPALKQESQLDCEHIVGFAGRFSAEKGLTVLIDAIRRLPKSVHALLIGNGPMRTELKNLAGTSDLAGRLHVLDVVEPSTLAELMNCMDVLCLPSLTTKSWKEQYGRVIAEAMACGVPVVGSDSGAIPEVIDSAGIVVPENDTERLAEALSLALFDAGAKERFRREGLIRAEKELSCKAMARKLYGFYLRVLET